MNNNLSKGIKSVKSIVGILDRVEILIEVE